MLYEAPQWTYLFQAPFFFGGGGGIIINTERGLLQFSKMPVIHYSIFLILSFVITVIMIFLEQVLALFYPNLAGTVSEFVLGLVQ